MSMKSSSAWKRLQAEYGRLTKDPIPYLTAQPIPSNLLEWRYVVRGPAETPYEGGIYQGKIVFPFEYPYKPPSLYILTPNGRFKTNTSLCLTITAYHPDSWNPSWSISSILNGFLSFMCDTSSTFGSIETTYAQKRKFAYDSLEFNIQDPIFCDLFPDITSEIKITLADRSARLSSANSTNNVNNEQEKTASSALNSSRASWLNSFIGNILVLGLLAVFALIVRFVVDSTS